MLIQDDGQMTHPFSDPRRSPHGAGKKPLHHGALIGKNLLYKKGIHI
jgi:hypothetical protein